MTIEGFSDPTCCMALQEEVRRLTRLCDGLMGKISQDAQRMKDDHHVILCLREMVDDLRKEVARLTPGPQWEKERDCWEVNDEYRGTTQP